MILVLSADVSGRNDLQSEHKSSTKSFELIAAEASRLEGRPETPRRRWSAAAMEPGANVSAIALTHGLPPQMHGDMASHSGELRAVILMLG